MKSFSIRAKLYISFLAVIALFAASTAWTISNIISLNGKEAEYSKRAEDIKNIISMEVAAMDQYRAQADLIINGNPAAIKTFEESAGEMDGLMKKARESADTDQERQLVDQLKKLDEDLDRNFKDRLIPAFQKQDKALMAEIDNQSDVILSAMDKIIHSLIQSYQGENKKALEDMNNMAQSTKKQSLVLLVISMILGAILAFLLARQITNPLNQLVEIFVQMSRGTSPGRPPIPAGTK